MKSKKDPKTLNITIMINSSLCVRPDDSAIEFMGVVVFDTSKDEASVTFIFKFKFLFTDLNFMYSKTFKLTTSLTCLFYHCEISVNETETIKIITRNVCGNLIFLEFFKQIRHTYSNAD